MDLGLDKKKVIVTGGTRGIGRAIAEKFMGDGANVLISGTREHAEGWWSEFSKCDYVACDFRSNDSVQRFQRYLHEKDVDILVNNAALFHTSDIEDIDLDRWEELMVSNVTVPMLLTKAVAPVMRRKKWGRVTNIGSIAGTVFRPGLGPYSTTKAALAALTRTCSLDLAPDNVLVNCVCPAYTETDMLLGLSEEKREYLLHKVPLGRFAQPEDIADVVVFLSSNRNQFITGQSIIVDGGVTIQ